MLSETSTTITPDEPAGTIVRRCASNERTERPWRRAPRRRRPPAPAARAWCAARRREGRRRRACRSRAYACVASSSSISSLAASRSRCSRTRAARPTDSWAAGWPERHASARADAASDRSRPSKCSATNSSARRRSAAPSSGLAPRAARARARAASDRAAAAGPAAPAAARSSGAAARRTRAAAAEQNSASCPRAAAPSSSVGDTRYDPPAASRGRRARPSRTRRGARSRPTRACVFITSTGQRTSVDARPPPTWSYVSLTAWNSREATRDSERRSAQAAHHVDRLRVGRAVVSRRIRCGARTSCHGAKAASTRSDAGSIRARSSTTSTLAVTCRQEHDAGDRRRAPPPPAHGRRLRHRPSSRRSEHGHRAPITPGSERSDAPAAQSCAHHLPRSAALGPVEERVRIPPDRSTRRAPGRADPWKSSRSPRSCSFDWRRLAASRPVSQTGPMPPVRGSRSGTAIPSTRGSSAPRSDPG